MINIGFWRNKHVFITGHTGFKGTWLLYWLHSMGAIVTGYALEPCTEPSIYKSMAMDKKISSIIGSICDCEKLKNAMKEAEPEIVFHLAAQPIVRQSYVYPIDTYMVNTIGTANLLECIKETNSVKSAVIITTDKVYKNKEWHWGYRENDELGGYDPYSCSKACAELITESYIKSYFSSESTAAVATARAGNVIGGGDWAADRLIPDCVKSVISKEKIIIRSPHSIRPWQHVIEPLKGYLMIAEKLYTNGAKNDESYNFGPDDEGCVNVETIVKVFCREWGNNSSYEIKQNDGPHEAAYLKLDCSKSKNLLNWKPIWSMETAVKKTVEWYKCYYQNKDIEKVMKQQLSENMGYGDD